MIYSCRFGELLEKTQFSHDITAQLAQKKKNLERQNFSETTLS